MNEGVTQQKDFLQLIKQMDQKKLLWLYDDCHGLLASLENPISVTDVERRMFTELICNNSLYFYNEQGSRSVQLGLQESVALWFGLLQTKGIAPRAKAVLLYLVGECYLESDFAKAMDYQQKAIIQLCAIGEYISPSTVAICDVMAISYGQQGDIGQSEYWYQKGETIGKAIVQQGEESQELVKLYQHWASTMEGQGQYGMAISYYQKSINSAEVGMEPSEFVIGQTYQLIGTAYLKMGNIAEAKASLTQAKEFWDSWFKGDNKFSASVVQTMAMLGQ